MVRLFWPLLFTGDRLLSQIFLSDTSAVPSKVSRPLKGKLRVYKKTCAYNSIHEKLNLSTENLLHTANFRPVTKFYSTKKQELNQNFLNIIEKRKDFMKFIFFRIKSLKLN